MVRNESLARILMLLCFGTAILSLAIQWSIHNVIKHDTKSDINKKLPSRTSFVESSQTPQTHHQSRWLVARGENVSNNTYIRVKLRLRRAYVYRDREVIASYPIAVGKKGWETPTGNYRVMDMQTLPVWRHPITGRVFPPGPDSPLGLRWIGFWSDGHDEIGFHGTPDEELVGTPVSHGCLRMRNSDVQLLYQQVHLGTPVTVTQ